MSERYYDSKAKDLYEFKMGLMIDEEYTTKFLELLRYLLYIKDEKAKAGIFVNRFPLAISGQIEYDMI